MTTGAAANGGYVPGEMYDSGPGPTIAQRAIPISVLHQQKDKNVELTGKRMYQIGPYTMSCTMPCNMLCTMPYTTANKLYSEM